MKATVINAYGEPVEIHDFWKSNGGDHHMREFSPSLTRQEFKDECDINVIMARVEAGGAVTHVNTTVPQYMDVSAIPDLATALQIMDEASKSFNSLPAQVRKEFDNDPVKFVEYAQVPENLAKMREWGLAPAAPAEPAPMLVKVVPEPAAAPPAVPPAK